MSQQTVKVWDIFVRIFHWSLVIFFTVAYFTGEEESNIHIYSGYIILGLVLSRILWGFIGSKYARFSNFVHSPNVVISYMKRMITSSSPRYIGHNPAGGYMVVAMLVLLLLVTYTGLKVYGLEGEGPLAQDTSIIIIPSAQTDNDEVTSEEILEDDESLEEFWEEVHEVLSNLMVLLIILHILGVIYSGRMHRENLPKAMINGRKKSD